MDLIAVCLITRHWSLLMHYYMGIVSLHGSGHNPSPPMVARVQYLQSYVKEQHQILHGHSVLHYVHTAGVKI
jgi:hypothetical protein